MACTPNKEELKNLSLEHPDILFVAIEKNPKAFIAVLSKAATDARKISAEKIIKEKQERIDAEFKNPKQPNIDMARSMFGNQDAKITIVEYSDFECPYCVKGYKLIKQAQEKYGKQIRIIFKHLPMSDRHPHSLLAAQYFEAIVLQNPAKSEAFYNELFNNQQTLVAKGEKFLKHTAQKIGVNMLQLKRDLNSEPVQYRIATDRAEAKRFGFSQSPKFLINGVTVEDTHSFSEFETIIKRHLEK